ncbi:hypothetical protein EJB05_21749, partial [Eragrostis curvula]
MAQQQAAPSTGSSILDTVPLFVVVLLAVHVLALVRPHFPLPSRHIARFRSDPDSSPLLPLPADEWHLYILESVHGCRHENPEK